jgi:5-methylcytosine-specific restriction protein A
MYRYRELAGDKIFRCKRCGTRKRVKYVPVSDLCRRCALEEVRLRYHNIPIELADNLIVTEEVAKRIRKRAHREIPLSKSERIGDALFYWSIPVIFSAAYFVANAISEKAVFLYWVPPACFAWLILTRVIDRLMVKPRKERFAIIERKVIEIAEIRKKTIEEALRFYSSPEWIAVRKRVIQEEGRICAECGKIIENDADVTVDHKSPRSKYREKELDRENLRVLCRRCNSSKGAKEFDL